MSTLIGHGARWMALARAFEKNAIPQTLLISGPPQVGKWTLARRFAQLLLCPSPTDDESGLPAPCGACRVCHQVEIETYPDFRVYRPILWSSEDERDWMIASEMVHSSIFPIPLARKFRAESAMKPVAGQRKVMVAMQVDRMNEEAQNCLLKTFEEPIAGLSILLLCDNADHLRATIRSRCWHLPLGLAGDADIAAWLRASTPASEEQIAAATLVAEGRPGAAWREIKRLQDGEASTPRFMQAGEIAERISRAHPVAALGLTEEALRLAKVWWDEDLRAGAEKTDLKKADAKILRSAIARFLDELATVYHARWHDSLRGEYSAPDAARWSDGLDQIRKTRHYILRNANSNLALDVLFGRLIAGVLH